MIEWEDSRIPISKWRYVDPEERYRPVSCVSVGWLLRDEKRVKVLVQNIGDLKEPENGQISGVMQISSRAVTKITDLKTVS